MGTVFIEILALSLGIAISPVPIMGTILMLISPGSKSASVGFAFGWVSGIAVAVTAFTFISLLLPTGSSGKGMPGAEPGPLFGWLQIGLGILLAVVAVVQWRRKAGGSSTGDALPKWMTAADKLSVGHAVTIGFFYAAFRPKNLLIAIATGLLIGSPELNFTQSFLAIVIFTALASFTIAAPILAYFFGNTKVEGWLEATSHWLVRNTLIVTSAAMLALAAILIWNGVGHVR
ncbi:GAP family protein [Lysinibacter cavernae]|uniref:GAP family protein n=1 Tax=Lysinibacter cavernae TaxID=1640652 RepID=A0A7X5R0D7_9MICO|nr:GAP family protein [Lysinibacter cavernae]NIH53328.1 hypothetical protein [Lysinibacter cavernae]